MRWPVIIAALALFAGSASPTAVAHPPPFAPGTRVVLPPGKIVCRFAALSDMRRHSTRGAQNKAIRRHLARGDCVTVPRGGWVLAGQAIPMGLDTATPGERWAFRITFPVALAGFWVAALHEPHPEPEPPPSPLPARPAGIAI